MSTTGTGRMAALLSALGFVFAICFGQTPGPGLTSTGALVKIQVKPYVDKPRQGLARKRFYLIKGSREQNKSLIHDLTSRSPSTRDCFYSNVGASTQFITWLKDNDCESVYCGEIEDRYIEGEKAVPEFRLAFESGLKEFGRRDLAKKWLNVSLPDKLRNGFYLRKQQELREVLKQTETASAASVLSVMTDRNGTAYFTNVSAGDYVISSLVPIELEANTILFNCDISIKSDDVGTEKPVRIQKQNKKCEVVEKPLPVCSTPVGER